MSDELSTPPVELDPTPAVDPAIQAVPTPATPIAATDPAPAPEPEVKGDWPEDWRQKYSTDPKVLKRLERYASPKAALDALFAAQTKISSGGLKEALKPDATPEEKAVWRENNGIPATPAEYDLTLPNGLIIGERDKPMVDEFLAKAHEANMHPDQVKETLSWFMDKQQTEVAALEARDAESRMKSEDLLRQEFGADYRRNVMIAKEVLDAAPDGVGEQIMAGRLADGTPIGNSPEVIRWLVALGRELNPVGTVVPGSGTNSVQAAETEMNNLRKMMGDTKSDYWKGPLAEKHQARYRELITAMEKGKGR